MERPESLQAASGTMLTYLLIMIFLFFVCYVTFVLISFTIFMAILVTTVVAMSFVMLLRYGHKHKCNERGNGLLFVGILKF